MLIFLKSSFLIYFKYRLIKIFLSGFPPQDQLGHQALRTTPKHHKKPLFGETHSAAKIHIMYTMYNFPKTPLFSQVQRKYSIAIGLPYAAKMVNLMMLYMVCYCALSHPSFSAKFTQLLFYWIIAKFPFKSKTICQFHNSFKNFLKNCCKYSAKVVS